jgi:hypothetical protein
MFNDDDKNWQLREDAPPRSIIDAHLAGRMPRQAPCQPGPVASHFDAAEQKIFAADY